MSIIKPGVVLVLILLFGFAVGASASGDLPGKKDYLADCARCHGVDGKGAVAAMRGVRGYRAVNLTQLSKENNGQFPRQKVYDTIDGRHRFPAHFVGDMPSWGRKYQQGEATPQSEAEVKRRISALVDYIESLQDK
jgi:mono/diheme cytochrome c family protein